MLNITSGKISRAQKCVIYGPEGICKTTIASRFNNPLFIDTEGGTAHMDVSRLDKPTSWDGLVSLVEAVAAEKGICGTLVLDTADWAEQICITDTCAKYKKAGIEEFGYGKGYTYVAEEFTKLLSALDKLIEAGTTVVVTAHAKMRKFEQPDEMGAYDRWEMKLSKQVAPLLKEWADMLLFCNYKTFVVSTETDKKKAAGGKRVMYASHHPCWDAKNRHGLPDEMEMSYDSIAHLFAPVKAALEQKASAGSLDQVKELMERDHIPEKAIQEIVSKKGHYDYFTPISEYSEKFLSKWVIANWDKIVEIVRSAEN